MEKYLILNTTWRNTINLTMSYSREQQAASKPQSDVTSISLKKKQALPLWKSIWHLRKSEETQHNWPYYWQNQTKSDVTSIAMKTCFKCYQCGKLFDIKDNLKKHKETDYIISAASIRQLASHIRCVTPHPTSIAMKTSVTTVEKYFILNPIRRNAMKLTILYHGEQQP